MGTDTIAIAIEERCGFCHVFIAAGRWRGDQQIPGKVSLPPCQFSVCFFFLQIPGSTHRIALLYLYFHYSVVCCGQFERVLFVFAVVGVVAFYSGVCDRLELLIAYSRYENISQN